MTVLIYSVCVTNILVVPLYLRCSTDRTQPSISLLRCLYIDHGAWQTNEVKSPERLPADCAISWSAFILRLALAWLDGWYRGAPAGWVQCNGWLIDTGQSTRTGDRVESESSSKHRKSDRLDRGLLQFVRELSNVLTRHAAEHFSSTLADCEFSAGCYLFSVSSSGLLFSHDAVTDFRNFTSTFWPVDCVHTGTCRSVTLNFDLWPWPSNLT